MIKAPKNNHMDELLEEWRRADRAIEGGLWERARIAASVVDVQGRRNPDVARFAEEVEMSVGRIHMLAATWRLRRAMPEHRKSVGYRAGGKRLSLSHFTYALSADDPAGMVRRAVREDLSSTQVLKLVRDEVVMRRASRKPPSPLAPERAPERAPEPVVDPRGFHTCESCGGETVALPALDVAMERFGMDARAMAYEAGVDQERVLDACAGRLVSQQIAYRMMEVIRKKLTEEERRLEAMGRKPWRGTRYEVVV